MLDCKMALRTIAKTQLRMRATVPKIGLRQRNVLIGVMAYLVAITGTSTLQSQVKSLLAIGLTINHLLVLRYWGSLLLVGLFIIARGTIRRKLPPPVRSFPNQCDRSLMMLGTTIGVFKCTAYLDVAQISALSLASVTVLTQLMAPLFESRIIAKKLVVISTSISLCGVGVMLSYSTGKGGSYFEMMQGIGWLLSASLCTARMQHLNRKAAKNGEDPYTSLLCQNIAGAIFVPIIFPLKISLLTHEVDVLTPRPTMLIGLIVLSVLPQLMYIVSAAHVPVSLTAPFGGVQTIWGTVLDRLNNEGSPATPWSWVALALLSLAAAVNVPAIRSQSAIPPPVTQPEVGGTGCARSLRSSRRSRWTSQRFLNSIL